MPTRCRVGSVGARWLPLSPEARDAVERDDDDVIDTRLAATPDGVPAWLEVGSVKAAETVAEQKIAQMEAALAAKQDAPATPASAGPATCAAPPAPPAEIKTYKMEQLPDAFDMPIGTRCTYEGRALICQEVNGETRWCRDEDRQRELDAAAEKAAAAPAEENPRQRQTLQFGRKP